MAGNGMGFVGSVVGLRARGTGRTVTRRKMGYGVSTMVMEKRETVRRKRSEGGGVVEGGSVSGGRREGRTATFMPKPDMEEVELLYEKAKSQQKAGFWLQALNMFNDVLKMDPTNGKVYIRISKIHEKQRNIDGCRTIMQRGLQANPSNAILWQNWADVEARHGNYDAARKLFEHARKANKTLHSIYNSWANLELKLGNVNKARKLLVQGLKFNPENVRLLYSLGVLEDKQQNSELARRLLMKGLEKQPDNAYLHQAMALVELKSHRVRHARECLRRATTLDSKNTLAWLTWAQLEELQANYDVARNYYRTGTEVKTAEKNVTLWQSWARMEEKLGREEEAIAIYEQAVEENPRDPLLYNEFGKLVRKMGDLKYAMEILHRGILVDGRCAPLFKSIALAQLEEGDLEAARKTFRTGEEFCSVRDMAPVYHAWAVMEWKNDDVTAARELFGKAVKVDPRSGWLWMWYGMFEIDMEHYDLARHYLACSIDADPTEGSAWRSWGELERKQGNEKLARFNYRRANELDNHKDMYNLDPESPLSGRCHFH